MSLVGEVVELLRHDCNWEAPLIEGPAMWLWGSTYFLFYSANWWESPNYSIGYATGTRPLGPFTKVTSFRPWLASAGDELGPGGPTIFTDPGGATHIGYHAWFPQKVGYRTGGARSLRIHRLDFEHNQPVVRR